MYYKKLFRDCWNMKFCSLMFINTFIRTVYAVFTSKGNSRNKNLTSLLNYVS